MSVSVIEFIVPDGIVSEAAGSGGPPATSWTFSPSSAPAAGSSRSSASPSPGNPVGADFIQHGKAAR